MKLGAYVFLWAQKKSLKCQFTEESAGNWPGIEATFLTESHRIGGNRKCSWQSTKADQKSLETVF